MQSRIGLWGGSCAVRLPKMAVESLDLYEGETVSLEIENGGLVIRPSRKRYTLNELVREARGLSAPETLDDAPMGDEQL